MIFAIIQGTIIEPTYSLLFGIVFECIDVLLMY